MAEVAKWTSQIQLLGMPSPKSTDTNTVELTIATQPRRFRGPASSPQIGEAELLADSNNYLLLGDPGSGKTTTLKRLARRLITSEAVAPTDIYQYPLVVRLRELTHGNLFLHIASLLGIKVQTVSIPSEGLGSSPQIQHWVGNLLLRDMLPQLLSATGAVIFLDGLDEMKTSLRAELLSDLRTLALKASDAKVICSCRSGDYIEHIDGFCLCEICPLSDAQIQSIASNWADNSDAFMAALADRAYYDVSDRPLLLVQLLRIFNKYGYLPMKASDVCRKLLRLLLEEWDVERAIHRTSVYANFEADQKLLFLSALAYHLTYVTKTKIFTEDQLVAAYAAVCEHHTLPLHQSNDVVREIESHNGIIVFSSSDRFEFSHLSFQEYLCADYLVRDAYSEKLPLYLQEYPAVVAVAACLAPRPGIWLAQCILDDRNAAVFDAEALCSFLARLFIESPPLMPSYELGLAALQLLFRFGDNSVAEDMLSKFVQIPAVTRSIAMALRHYRWSKDAISRVYRLERRFLFKSDSHVLTPTRGSIKSQHLDMILTAGNLCLTQDVDGSWMTSGSD